MATTCRFTVSAESVYVLELSLLGLVVSIPVKAFAVPVLIEADG